MSNNSEYLPNRKTLSIYRIFDNPDNDPNIEFVKSKCIDKLKEEYQHNRKIISKPVSSNLGLHLFILISSMIVIYLIKKDEKTSFFEAIFIISAFIYWLFRIIRIIYNLYFYKSLGYENLISQYRNVDESDFPNIWAVINELKEKMELQFLNIQLLLDVAHTSPSIMQFRIRDEDRIVLLLPIELIALADKNIRHFRAIVSHELAHILNKDPNLWLNHQIFDATYLPPSLFADVPFRYLSEEESNDSLSEEYNYERRRKISELFADMCTIIFNEDLSIIEVIKKYSSKKSSCHHLSKINRIRAIEYNVGNALYKVLEVLRKKERNIYNKVMSVDSNFDSIKSVTRSM
jgi:hypothetical protein